MKRGILLLAFLVAITIAGGVITSGLTLEIPVIRQTSSPDASVFEATPEQANLLTIWIGFVLFNLVGAGVTIMILFWLGNREVARANAMPSRPQQTSLPETSADAS